MIEWALLAGGLVSTVAGTLAGAVVGRGRERDLATRLAGDERRASGAELRRVRTMSDARIEELEHERAILRRALLLSDGAPFENRNALLQAALVRLGGLALVGNAVVADDLGLEVARLRDQDDSVQLAALALAYFAIESIFPSNCVLITEAEGGLFGEVRALPVAGQRSALVVTCKGQRPSRMAIDATLAYLATGGFVRHDAPPMTNGYRGDRYIHYEASESARLLAEELDGIRSTGGLLGVSIVDGQRLLASASDGGARREVLQRLAVALPDVTKSTERRLGAPWVRSDVFFHDGSSLGIRRVSPKGRFLLVVQSTRPVSDLELDRITGRLRRFSGPRPNGRIDAEERAS